MLSRLPPSNPIASGCAPEGNGKQILSRSNAQGHTKGATDPLFLHLLVLLIILKISV